MFSGSFIFSKRNHNHHQSSGKLPDSPFGNTGKFNNVRGSNGGVVPPVLLEESRVPRFYIDCLTSCGATSSSQLPNTGLVYNLMISSQLSRDVLSEIWTMVNRTIPGQLTRQEFFSCLALIALTQKGESISALCNINTLPIPNLQNSAVARGVVPTFSNGTNGKAVIHPSSPKFSTKTSTINNTFNPKPKSVQSVLLNGNKKKDEKPKRDPLDDLLGELCVSTTPSGPDCVQTSEIDLTDLDLSLEPDANFNTKEPRSEVDPYDVLREAPQQNEHLSTWDQLLTVGCQILNSAIELLQRTPSLSREIVTVERGIKFVQTLRAIAIVLNRVALTTHRYFPQQKAIIDRARQSLRNWNKVLQDQPYIVAAFGAHPPSYAKILGYQKPGNGVPYCSVCLHTISDDDTYQLESGDCHYHSPCANFWVNHVDVGLPRLGEP